jgi:hypothetical protein
MPKDMKTAKYWRAFTAASRAQAEKAAETWWAGQSGLDKISGWTLPAPESLPSGASEWTVTIIYRPSGPDTQGPTIH